MNRKSKGIFCLKGPVVSSTCATTTQKNQRLWTLRALQDREPFSACIYASWDGLWGRDCVCVHLEM